jgi:medium-chain acyl-[acyl-carrier-protein] hydrolase
MPRLRLFCFPYAGGGAQVFREWPTGLPGDIEVCAVELPGRGARFLEAPYLRMEPLLADLQTALDDALDRPFAFFGHSLGALLAFELTRRLRRAGAPLPVQLLVSARRAPQVPRRDSGMSLLSDEEFVAELRRYGRTPEVVLRDPELMAALLPMVRADFSVLESWRYRDERPLDIPLTVLGGTHDEYATPAELRAWQAQTYRPLAVHMVPGHHFFLESARREVLALIRGTLELDARYDHAAQ